MKDSKIDKQLKIALAENLFLIADYEERGGPVTEEDDDDDES